MAGELGIRQFLDLGCGLPIPTDIHEVAQAVAPESKVVYVDNDPLVMAYARALLVGDPLGVTDHIEADVRNFDAVMTQAARTLDFREPVAVIMSGILNHIVDDNEAQSLVARIVSAVPAGSYLVISDHTNVDGSQQAEAEEIWNQHAQPPYRLRTPDQIAGFFNGLELVEPGAVSATRWRPDLTATRPPGDLGNLVGVGLTAGASSPPPATGTGARAARPRRRHG